MKNIIILEKEGMTELWGGITNACRAHSEFHYHSIKSLKFPFHYKGFSFQKVVYNQKNIK